MPGSLMMADANFPRFTGSESTEQKISTIQNYLFQLTEQLRWAYANIGKENFNETEFKEISEIITEPVYITLEEETGKIRHELTVTEEGLRSEIKTAEENLSTKITQTVDGIELAAENSKTGNTSTLTLTSNGVTISSASIEFEGMVTFASLRNEDDRTVINGAKITTGIIDAMDLYGSNFYCTMDANDLTTGDIFFCYPNNNTVVGGLQISNSGSGTTEESKYRVFLYTKNKFALKLQSVKGISIESDGGVYIRGGVIHLNGSVYINGHPLTVTA